MKNIFKSVLSLLVLALMLASCEKDYHKNYFEGSTAPALTASSTAPLVLTDANKANQAIKFTWSNPNYQFTTGVSSQTVNYVLQVDTTGSNFTNPARQDVAYTGDLSVAFTVKELNSILTKLDMAENRPHNIEFRVKATLGNNSVPVYSNVIKIVITPYLDVAVPIPPTGELFITGSAMPSDWTNNPPATQKFTKISTTEYTITVNLAPGKEYKFLSNLNAWQPQYGGSSATGGDLGFNMGGGNDPAAIPTPGVSGSYKITVFFKTGKYTVVKL